MFYVKEMSTNKAVLYNSLKCQEVSPNEMSTNKAVLYNSLKCQEVSPNVVWPPDCWT